MSVWGIIFGSLIVVLGVSVSIVSALNGDPSLAGPGTVIAVAGGVVVGASIIV